MIGICCGATMDSDSDICPDCKEHTDSEYENSTEAYDEGFYNGFKDATKKFKKEYYDRAKRNFLFWNECKRKESKELAYALWFAYKASAKRELDWMKFFNNGRIR